MVNDERPIERVPAATEHLHWQSAYECGHRSVDEQHKALFTAANALLDAAATGPTALMIERLDELIMHTIIHFRDEEALLERHGYPELREHRKAHARLLERSLTFRDRLLTDPQGASDLIEFITKNVIAHHMIEVDKSFFEALRG